MLTQLPRRLPNIDLLRICASAGSALQRLCLVGCGRLTDAGLVLALRVVGRLSEVQGLADAPSDNWEACEAAFSDLRIASVALP